MSWGHQYPLSYDQFPQLAEAAALARSALEQDDTLSYAHMAAGWNAFVRERKWEDAAEHFKKAIQFDPNNWEPHEWYGWFLSAIGQTNQAIAQLEVAERLGGSEPDVKNTFGQVFFAARQYARAAEKFQKAIEMPEMGDKQFSKWQMTRALFWKEPNFETIEQWLEATYGAREPWVSELKRVLRDEGPNAFWKERLNSVRTRSKDPLILADACVMAGETNEALDFLELAFREHHDFLVHRLKTDPEWDVLRSNSRFQEILRELGLSD